MGIHVSAGVRRGGLPPGSYEAQDAIQRVKELMNPTHFPKRPAWSIVVPVEQDVEQQEKPKQVRVNRYAGVEARCRVCEQPFVKTGHNHVICGKPGCVKAVKAKQQAEWRAKKRGETA